MSTKQSLGKNRFIRNNASRMRSAFVAKPDIEDWILIGRNWISRFLYTNHPVYSFLICRTCRTFFDMAQVLKITTLATL